ncbi:MAG: Ig-like domain-containing protein [Alphaproteobacteria bacterium]
MQRLVLIIGAVIIIAAAAYLGLVRPDLIGLGGDDAAQSENAETGDAVDADEAPGDEPVFDIVRISADATAVIAGRALPGSTVTVMRDGASIGEVVANDRGEWVLTLDQPMPSGAAKLTLVAKTPEGETFTSDGTVVIAIPDGAGRALAVLMTPGDKSVVLQGVAPGDDRVLTVDTIDYDDKGNVIFAGRALPDHEVRVYLNNTLVGRVDPNEAGTWRLVPDVEIDPGKYELRADQVDKAGKVTARIAIPFLREEPSRLVFNDGQVVVQPGNSLWRIASHVYGSGFQYSLIYEANDDQIRDPDLIYPGQMFALPGADPK